MATKDMKNQLLKDYEAKITEVNTVCTKGTNAEVEGKLAELLNIEKEYRSLLEKEVFASLNDIHEALVRHHFETISHKKISQEGRMTGIEKATKNVQIDLRRFCEYKSFDLAWFYELQALNKRLTLRKALELGVTTREVRVINDSYSMDKLASEIELGKTPTSDTQVIKHMQKVLDTLSPEEGKVNGHDLAYVLSCYTKKNNKTALRVICSKHTVLQSLLTDVFHRVVTGGVYSVDYKKDDGKIAEPKADAPNKKGSEKPADSPAAKVPDAAPIAPKKDEVAA